jgi:23S rRNA pseudouridine1911/1915/1917 synthase
VGTIRAGAESAGQRLDRFLTRRLPERSRAQLQQWIEAGHVTVEGQPTKASRRLRGGETIVIHEPAPAPAGAFPEAIPLAILYEDEDLVAINKPAGLVVHVGAGRGSGTLVNALLHRYGVLGAGGDAARPGIVHRLDRGTSGVMVAARTEEALRRLARQFAQRETEKRYLALVEGAPRAAEGEIDRSIARDPRRRTRMTARLQHGREAHTEWKVRERFAGYTLLEVLLGTGRTHQIRVHLAAEGHPIAGDTLYGARRQLALERPFLHAWRLCVLSPSTGRPLHFEAPLAPELEAFLEALRAV